jgi:hypothetical protein
MTKIEQEVWNTIVEMNKVWTVEAKPEKLKNYFHKNMVAIVPTSPKRVEGRAACVAGWKSFVDAAKINYWKELEPLVSIYNDGQTAVVTYYFDMSFDMAGQTIKMKGRDMFTLVNENGKWWVAADQFSPMPG